jgi:hypothetical protein
VVVVVELGAVVEAAVPALAGIRRPEDRRRPNRRRRRQRAASQK